MPTIDQDYLKRYIVISPDQALPADLSNLRELEADFGAGVHVIWHDQEQRIAAFAFEPALFTPDSAEKWLKEAQDAKRLDAMAADAQNAAPVIYALASRLLAVDESETPPGDTLIWKEILRPGSWFKTDTGRRVDVTPDIILEAHRAYAEGMPQYISVPADHHHYATSGVVPPEANRGFVPKLVLTPDYRWFAGFDLRDPVTAEGVRNGTIADCSVFLQPDVVHNVTGKKYPWVLRHVLLTNNPLVTGLGGFGEQPPIAAAAVDPPVEVYISAGGPGSGNFGHTGRPGQRGGSASAALPHPALASRYLGEFKQTVYVQKSTEIYDGTEWHTPEKYAGQIFRRKVQTRSVLVSLREDNGYDARYVITHNPNIEQQTFDSLQAALDWGDAHVTPIANSGGTQMPDEIQLTEQELAQFNAFKALGLEATAIAAMQQRDKAVRQKARDLEIGAILNALQSKGQHAGVTQIEGCVHYPVVTVAVEKALKELPQALALDADENGATGIDAVLLSVVNAIPREGRLALAQPAGRKDAAPVAAGDTEEDAAAKKHSAATLDKLAEIL
ncbi:MAG: hypothetical protein JXA21_06800 [Anaerolineae bacterium]|nr:hypothetical protein [Anaerolineae bacterium]